MGLRITTLHAQTSPASASDPFAQVLTTKRDSLYTDPQAEVSNVNRTLPGNFTYQETGGYEDKGGFVMFMPGNQSLNDSLATY